jgi:hypothetical protein
VTALPGSPGFSVMLTAKSVRLLVTDRQLPRGIGVLMAAAGMPAGWPSAPRIRKDGGASWPSKLQVSSARCPVCEGPMASRTMLGSTPGGRSTSATGALAAAPGSWVMAAICCWLVAPALGAT